MTNRIRKLSLAIPVVVMLFGVISAWANIAPPTGERDLVVFIAKYKPSLYRLVGQQPRPYGTAQFYSPQAIVADAAERCIYVLDRPKLLSETTKIWRIAADGTPTLAFQGHATTNGGPFGKPVSLGLDAENRLLVADAMTGLWRLEPNGHLQRLFDGKDKPLYKISAVTAAPKGGLIVGTSYLYAVTGGQMLDLPSRMVGQPPSEYGGSWSPSPGYGVKAIVRLTGPGVGNSTGRQAPIRIWKNQGGLFGVDTTGKQAEVLGLQANRKPGGAEYDTYWRALNQVFVDASGRTVLVDAGSVWTRKEDVYIRPNPPGEKPKYPQTRTTTSVINGGIFVLHPDGRFEELTFKTPDGASGPMRRPHGAAQWSDDTYLVADPEMYVKGITGTGGLLLLNLDGSRQARWPFGERLRPLGVGILRGVGTPAQSNASSPIRLSELAGNRTAGKITAIESVSWESKPQGGGGLLGPVGMNWDVQPKQKAEAKLRSIFENANWSIGPDGTLHFSAAGLTPQTQGTPLVMTGTVTQLDGMVSVSARYKSQSMFDTQLGSLDVRIHGAGQGTAKMSITTNIFTKTERLKATFEQTLPFKGK